MHAISSYRANRPTHTPTNRQDRLQYTAPQLAHSVSNHNVGAAPCYVVGANQYIGPTTVTVQTPNVPLLPIARTVTRQTTSAHTGRFLRLLARVSLSLAIRFSGCMFACCCFCTMAYPGIYRAQADVAQPHHYNV